MSSNNPQIGETKRVGEVILRMRHRIGVNNDADLALYLNVSPKTLANWKTRNSIPEEYTRDFAGRTATSLDWLVMLHGQIGDYDAIDASDRPDARKPRQTAQERAGYSPEFAFVNQYAAKPSAGDGSVIEDQPAVSVIAFRHDWLAKRRQSNAEKLAAFEVNGDSMEPTLFSGDLIVFDLAEKAVTVEDIYLFRLGGNLYVKRLRLMPDGDVLMISDNPRYEPVPIGEATAVARSFEVIGRFFWRGGDRL